MTADDPTPSSPADATAETTGDTTGDTASGGGRPLAVVTGASSGIGLELAKQFAEHGFDLLVAAEDDEITVAAAVLRAEGDGEVEAVQVDLRNEQGVAALYTAIRADGRPVAAIALNAGHGQGGAFVDTDLADELSIIDLNVVSTVRLAKLVLRDMVAADAGRVLVTSSIAATMPGSFQAVYNASKSFLQSFTEALQDELKDTGVTLTSLMPGPTDTDFFERADMADDTAVGTSKKDDPAQVARQGFEALMDGKARVVGGGLKTKVQEAAGKAMPDKLKAAMHRRMAEPGSGD
ncbi:SDR family oxidoreductase [Nocardioides sp. zg-1228]|uniref:SDR family NAD(P)-dependent oxidoreductase n=1 Tax=Nocardioides sp. zg-1228 TaxID=2763008 RepID=UPI00164349B9|nr:SDR family NAD(P)-dependent oxidoreductase [Nocardioides sp. zg-1228]MBC2934232.1 SDR family NAD(P)-dependent oxidoreductase [Nocardioides sp. zg-1228]QSF59014.1 SDR family NAD(P)-dependent oxidoreductase [Nocardioides sp. zg-1228]